MRLFIAIDFDAAVKAALLDVQDELRARCSGATFSTRDNLHLTLAFLGECDSVERAAAETAMDIDFGAFDLTFDGVGRFRGHDGDTWYVDLAKSPALISLQSRLVKRLTAAGLPVDARPFRPHVTLARRVATAIQPCPCPPIHAGVDRVVLMESHRLDGDLIYSPLATKMADDTRP